MKRWLLFLFCLFSTAAYADLPPPSCSIEDQKRSGEECGVCLLGEKPDVACQEEMQKKGFEKRCVGPGANGTEVWCGPVTKTPEPTQVTPPQKTGICAVGLMGNVGGVVLLFSLFVGLALLSRRSSRAQ